MHTTNLVNRFISWLLLFGLAMQFALAGADAATGEKEITEAELREILAGTPNRLDALEQLAILRFQQGDFRAADAMYSRLLNLTLDEPGIAFGYAVAKWHLHQEYDAQAALLAAAEKSGNTVAIAAAKDILEEIYAPDGLSKMLREEIPDASRIQSVQWIEALWKNIAEAPLQPVNANANANASPGRHSHGPFLALWLGYSHAARSDLKAARNELKIALQSARDDQTGFSARAGLKLLDGLEAGATYQQLLNIPYQVNEAMPPSMQRHKANPDPGIYPLLDRLENLVQHKNLSGAIAMLDQFHAYDMDEMENGKYFLHLGEMWWALDFYDRAAQSFAAALTVSPEGNVIASAGIRLAQYAARNGDREKAVMYARRSADAARDQSWRQREVGNFLLNLGMKGEGTAYFERAVAAAVTPQEIADSYSALMELYKQNGDKEKYLAAAGRYSNTIKKLEAAPTDNEKGMAWYYQGEIQSAAGDADRANQAYVMASKLLTDDSVLSDVYWKMADYAATRGDKKLAAEYAERSGEKRPEDWVYRRNGDFFLKLEQPDLAFRYFDLSVKLINPGDNATAYAIMADAYSDRSEPERSLRYAERYAEIIAEKGGVATAKEQGLAAYYRGKILAEQKKFDEAYRQLVFASRLLTDKTKLADAYALMADYAAERGERGQAAEYAEKSAENRPEDWVYRRTGDLLFKLDQPDKAFSYIDRAVKLSRPDDNATANAIMADAYSAQNDPARSLRYARRYVEAVTAKGTDATPDERGLAAYYRGKILEEEEKPDPAFRQYEEASGLLVDPAKLSESYGRMADYKAKQGDREQAAVFAGKSLALLPNEDWKIRQVADLYIAIGMREKGIKLYESRLERAGTKRLRAEMIRDLAELHKRLDNQSEYLRYAKMYYDLVASPDFEPIANEVGIGWYYRGEIHSAAKDLAQAHQAYRNATELLTDNMVLADVFWKMAEYEAEHGDRKLAIAYAIKSAHYRPEGWVFRRTGDFLFKLERPDLAFDYFDRSVKLGDPEDEWTAYRIMSDAYNDRNEPEQSVRYGRRYVEIVCAKGSEASSEEQGYIFYYRGKILAQEKKPDEAYYQFACAARSLTDKGKLSEAYMLMADHHAGKDEKEKAAEFAEKSLALLPDEDWKVRQVADLYIRIDRTEKGISLYESVLERARPPKRRAEAIRDLAELHKRLYKKDGYICYAGMYRDLVACPGFTPTANEKGLAWYYQGEIFSANMEKAETYQAYTKASRLLTENYLLSDVLWMMSEYKEGAGEMVRAGDLAERSAAKRNDEWGYRRTGDLFLKLDLPDKAFDYYDRSAKVNNQDDNVTAYASLADAYSDRNDTEQFLSFAGRYIELVNAKGVDATKDEIGLASLYQGRILAEGGEYEEAYRWYGCAAEELENKRRIAAAYKLMADYWAERGEFAQAVLLAEKARAEQPKELWLLNFTAGLYVDLKQPATAVKLFEEFIAPLKDVKDKAGAYVTFAELYRRIGDKRMFNHYARLYVDINTGPQFNLQDDRGNHYFYQGEIAAMDYRMEEAYRYYTLSVGYFLDKFRLSEVAMRQAEYHVMRDNLEQAAMLGELSGAHLPNEIWRQTNVAGFFGKLDDNYGKTKKMNKVEEYFNRALAIAKTPREEAQVFESMANFYREKGNLKKYVMYAGNYVDAIGKLGKKATYTETGNRLFFTAEIYSATKHPHQAYAVYEEAANVVKEPNLLSSIYFNMARYNLKYGDRHLTAQFALAGAGLLPDKRWKVAEAIGILAEVGQFSQALEIAQLAIQMDPEHNKALYQTLATMYFNKVGDRKTASAYQKMFTDYLYGRNEQGPQPVPRHFYEELWYARGAQNGIDRTWGLESYYSATRWNSGDYWTGMWHHLYRNYHLKNGWFGKIYFQYGGTFDSQFTSYHYIDEFETRSNVSRSGWGDSSYFLVGATIHPINKKWWNGFEFWSEYQRGLGKNDDNDFRLGVKYSIVQGDWLRPTGNRWNYWRVETNNWYSFKDKVFRSFNEVRRGIVYVNDCDRNLLIIPYGFATAMYDGNNKEFPFGSDAGIALTIKKYFREDRYHGPRSNIDLNISYRWPLTRGRDPAFGVTLSTSF